MVNIKEEWKEINGYKISNYGRVINKRGYELKNTPSKNGYVSCSINLGEDIGEVRGMHRVVATAFIPNPHNLPEVNHMDGNKSNNRVDNLEWVSRSGNQHHASYVLNKRIGEDNYHNTLTEDEVIQIYDLCKYTKIPYKEIAEMYEISEDLPNKITSRTVWKYLDLKPFNRKDKPIIGINVDTGKELKYDSVRFATKDGFSISCISSCCKGRSKSHKGYVWKYY